jgi:hypothetical protein
MTKKFGLVPSEKIFGIGSGRTGTHSLARALTMLGYKETYHGKGRKRTLHWIKGIQCLTNSPAPGMFKFLDYCFPDAKFILTIRSTETWIRSARQYNRKRTGGDSGGEELYKNGMIRGNLDRAYARFLVFNRVSFNEQDHIVNYERHNKEVFEHFFGREGKLLVMKLCHGEGWDVLCPFLGCEIPEEPFPHTHKQFNKKGELVWKKG